MGHKRKKPKLKAHEGFLRRTSGFVPVSAPVAFGPEFARWMAREELRYRLGSDCKAQVVFEGPVTHKGIKRLITYLEMALEDFPEKTEVATGSD